MVSLTLITICAIDIKTSKIRDKIGDLERQMSGELPKLQEEVIDGKTNQFYEVSGKRAYITIDNLSAESYQHKSLPAGGIR